MITPATISWLRAGMLAYLETGDPLQKCLNINRRQFLLSKRNKHLCNAFDCLDSHRSVRYRCQTLLKMINEFMFNTLRGYSGEGPDSEWPLIEVEIFYALRCRLGYPDLRMLEIIIQNNVKSQRLKIS